MEQDLPLFARGPDGGIISPYLAAKGEEFNEWQKSKSRAIKAKEREMANDIYNWGQGIKTLSNMGRKISEAKLPHIGSGRQRSMPTYTLDYNAFKWVPTPISGPATWTLGFAGLGLADAPILFADNAIDTIANGLPNVYNWAVDEYNAGASKRALNNYINNEGKEAREKIQRRQNQTMPVATVGRTLQTIPTTEQAQQVVTQNNEMLGRMQEAKRLVTNELRRLNAAGELLKNVSRTQKLINLYKKLK